MTIVCIESQAVFSRRSFLQAASAALALSGPARAAGLVRHPYLQNVGANHASVLWTTANAGAGSVTLTSAGNRAPLTVPATMQAFPAAGTGMAASFYLYQADIAGLVPHTQYRYNVAVDGQDLLASPAAFHTAPADRFGFLAFGDSGADSAEQQTLVQLMANEPFVSMVVHVGDMAYPDGTYEQLEDAYFGVNAPLMARLPFFSTPGNHEYNTDSAAPYLSGVVTPPCGVPAADVGRYYSFDWGNAHFVAVDSNLLLSSRAGAMLAWLDADLAATSQYWRIVFLHHTPYPTGFHLGDPICAAVQQLVNPIVESHGVQLVLAGHEHGYERTYPLAGGQLAGPSSPSTTYIVTGGGGGLLESVGTSPQTAISVQAYHYLRVDVDGPSLTLTAVGLDGGAIDQVTLGGGSETLIQNVLSKGDYSPAMAPGSLVAITGRNLAKANVASRAYPLPSALGGVSVKAGGQPLPLVSVSSTEIQAQLPYHMSGSVTLELSTPDGAASASIAVSPAAPSLLEIVSGRRLFSAANPARPGSDLSLYLTGLGEVQGRIEPGCAAPIAGLPAGLAVEVWLGPLRIAPRFAGLAPGHAGVYRVDFAVPRHLPDGIYALRVTCGGVSSRAANLDLVSSGRGDRNDRACLRVITE